MELVTEPKALGCGPVGSYSS